MVYTLKAERANEWGKKGRGGGERERERGGLRRRHQVIIFSKCQFHSLFILPVLNSLGGAGRPIIVSSHMISSFGFNATWLLCPQVK